MIVSIVYKISRREKDGQTNALIRFEILEIATGFVVVVVSWAPALLLPLAQYRDRCVTNDALAIAKTPPISLVVQHFD